MHRRKPNKLVDKLLDLKLPRFTCLALWVPHSVPGACQEARPQMNSTRLLSVENPEPIPSEEKVKYPCIHNYRGQKQFLHLNRNNKQQQLHLFKLWLFDFPILKEQRQKGGATGFQQNMEKHITYSPSFDNYIYTSVTHNYPVETQDYQDVGSIEQHLLWELVLGPDFRSAAGDAGKRLRTAEKGSKTGLDIIKKNSLSHIGLCGTFKKQQRAGNIFPYRKDTC